MTHFPRVFFFHPPTTTGQPLVGEDWRQVSDFENRCTDCGALIPLGEPQPHCPHCNKDYEQNECE